MHVRSTRHLLLLILWISGGCGVTEEDIDRWKTTQKGPERLAKLLSNDGQAKAVRASALVALGDIKDHGLIRRSFEALDAEDADAVIAEAVPLFQDRISGSGTSPDVLESSQVVAKDALYLLLDFVGPQSRDAVHRILIEWCTTGNFGAREKAGFNIRLIAQKVGTPALLAMAELITLEQPFVRNIGELLRDTGDKEALKRASQKLVEEMGPNVGKFSRSHLETASIIGGEPVGDMLLQFAARKDMDAEFQRLSLRAFSAAVDNQHIDPTPAQVDRLIEVAEDPQYDRFHREESYMTLGQISLPASVSAIQKLLRDRDFFFRMVGVRCLLRMDAPAHLVTLLETPQLVSGATEVTEMVDLLARFPAIREDLLKVAAGNHAVSRGLALLTLARIGTPSDIDTVRQWVGVTQRLPAGFGASTVGAAAKETVRQLEQKG